jgi:hypothetical protein
MAAERARTLTGTPPRARVGELARRAASDPFLPIPALAAAIGASMLLDHSVLAWMAFAALAGHSLSGST